VPLDLGLSLPFTAAGQLPDPSVLIRAAQQAEAAGYDSVWTGDHVLHPEPLLEALVTLATLAACTHRVRLGVAVMLIALRSPLVVARQLSTLAAFAPGRLVLGVGVGGEYPPEWDLVGVPVKERGVRTSAAVAEVQRLLADDGPLPIEPRPEDPVPVVFGGRRPAALLRAATMGDGWIGQLHSATAFAALRAEIAALRQAAGLTAPFSYGMLLRVRISRTPQPAGERYVLHGAPDELVELLAPYLASGCDRLILSPERGPTYPRQCEELIPVVDRLRALVPSD
jgi:alkanesulfonate monooxygenase SsuD/methylene tetrahydromethanopterin reductase-like flavin-dependent oxidoreductase (luciferase family)